MDMCYAHRRQPHDGGGDGAGFEAERVPFAMILSPEELIRRPARRRHRAVRGARPPHRRPDPPAPPPHPVRRHAGARSARPSRRSASTPTRSSRSSASATGSPRCGRPASWPEVDGTASVTEALGWGFIAASSLVLGGLIALRWSISTHLLGLVMAFGAGVLISAVAYDIVLDAYETSEGSGGVGVGLAAGRCRLRRRHLARPGRRARKRSGRPVTDGGARPSRWCWASSSTGSPSRSSSAWGCSRVSGSAWGCSPRSSCPTCPRPSTLPSGSAAAATGAGSSGLGMIALVCGLASLAGYAVFDGASPRSGGLRHHLRRRRLLTMLADTMMPEAFEHGGRSVGLVTTLGFGLAVALHPLE